MSVFSGSTFSIIFDFLVKAFNKPDVWFDAVEKLPLVSGVAGKLIKNRFLRLNCLTANYKTLWEEVCEDEISHDSWTQDFQCFENEIESCWSDLDSKEWIKQYSIRTDLSRRQAILEIDVLVAISLNISLEELITIYNHYFYTFAKYDSTDEFDQNGLLIPNFVRQTPGRNEVREALKNWDGQTALKVAWYLKNGQQKIEREFIPPFFKVDRIEDYKTAYRVFSERLGLNKSETME